MKTNEWKKSFCRLTAGVVTLLLIVMSITGCMTVNTYAGVRSASFNEEGELVLTYEDGHTENILLPTGTDKEAETQPTESASTQETNPADSSDTTGKPAKKDKTSETEEEPEVTEIPIKEKDKGTETEAEADTSKSGTVKPTKSLSELFPDEATTTDTVPEVSGVTAAASKGLLSAVSIVCTYTVSTTGSGSSSGIYIPGYGYYGGSGSGSTQTQQSQSAGSGVIYRINKETGDALIITNYHVVYSSSATSENGIADDISVYLYGSEISSKAIEASYVGGSMYYDIAILYIADSELIRTSCAEAVTIADSDNVNVGDTAIAIGNPEGSGTSVTFGTVSVDSEYISMTAADDKTAVSFRVLRVDTAVNSGNSGGGLYDANGNLIGIVNAKINSSSVENIGYAIPSAVVSAIAENILDYCFGTDCETVQRGLLGITVTTSDSSAYIDSVTGLVKKCEKIEVVSVNDGGLADGVLETGDVITAISLAGRTREITRQYQLIDFMLEVRQGDVVTLTIVRDGKLKTVSFTVTADCITSY